MDNDLTQIDAVLGTDEQPVVGVEQAAVFGANHTQRGIAREGHTPFVVPLISQIKDNLWTGGCINGLPLPPLFEHLVSVYPWESYLIGPERKISRLEVYMYDSSGTVDDEQVWAIAEWITDCVKRGPTLVHCQAGLNRSSLVASAALILMGVDDPVKLIREQRSSACLCNRTFETWVSDRSKSGNTSV